MNTVAIEEQQVEIETVDREAETVNGAMSRTVSAEEGDVLQTGDEALLASVTEVEAQLGDQSNGVAANLAEQSEELQEDVQEARVEQEILRGRDSDVSEEPMSESSPASTEVRDADIRDQQEETKSGGNVCGVD